MESYSWIDKHRLLWQNGKCVDLWTVVHIVMGALYASVFYLIGAPKSLIVWAGLAVAVLWELWEFARTGKETISNQIIDVAVFVLAAAVVVVYVPNEPEGLFVLIALLGVLRLTLRYLGYESYYWRQERGLK